MFKLSHFPVDKAAVCACPLSAPDSCRKQVRLWPMAAGCHSHIYYISSLNSWQPHQATQMFDPKSLGFAYIDVPDAMLNP